MKRFALPVAVVAAVTACARPDIGPEPSLAPRAAEAIDPRVAIPAEVPMGSVDAVLASRLAALVGDARAAQPGFTARLGESERVVAAAGAAGSEGWIAAQQSLSKLIEQHGVTTRVAADIDELAATKLKAQRWLAPADREAITRASGDVAAISNAQDATINRLRQRLGR